MTATQQLPEMVLKAPPEGFRYDKKKDGWELREDVGAVIGEPTLVLAEFLREGESYVKGDVMVARAKEMTDTEAAGQMHAERLLEEQDQIPVEWRGKYLVFTGTIWRDPGGGLGVPCLRWRGGQWDLGFVWLGGGWGGGSRLVRLRK